ncbi:unnamed protein product [Blepharisma stoltei]|uniref:Uncharacterized protein n=1 Tax=Blepharisma stoltei TaxID=1481888 RepID=A0AAU9KHB4_9CILI|nr:unnamed protein product [Blepharisma stoltei]
MPNKITKILNCISCNFLQFKIYFMNNNNNNTMERNRLLIYNLEDFTQHLDKIYSPELIKSPVKHSYPHAQESFLDIMNSIPNDFENSPQLTRNSTNKEYKFHSDAIFSFSSKVREEAKRMTSKGLDLKRVVQKMNDDLSSMLNNHHEVLSFLIDSQHSGEVLKECDINLKGGWKENLKVLTERSEMKKHYTSIFI